VVAFLGQIKKLIKWSFQKIDLMGFVVEVLNMYFFEAP